MVRANGLEFGLLEAGTGPLALCLHGFPDSAYTWRHLLPALAEVGFHGVAPFLRGYAPTAVPDDACYGLGALVADAVALHQALDGDGDAVLIGHDWGAEAAYGAASFAPDRWRRVVTEPYAAEEHAASLRGSQPTLYLHGSADGNIAVELVGGAEPLLPASSRLTLVQGAGHFLHLEQPAEVNRHILAWVTG